MHRSVSFVSFSSPISMRIFRRCRSPCSPPASWNWRSARAKAMQALRSAIALGRLSIHWAPSRARVRSIDPKAERQKNPRRRLTASTGVGTGTPRSRSATEIRNSRKGRIGNKNRSRRVRANSPPCRLGRSRIGSPPDSRILFELRPPGTFRAVEINLSKPIALMSPSASVASLYSRATSNRKRGPMSRIAALRATAFMPECAFVRIAPEQFRDRQRGYSEPNSPPPR